MIRQDDSANLAGKLLIASPGMEDPRFRSAVVFLCAHSEDGSMGLIVNKPTPEIKMHNLLEQLEIPTSGDRREIRVHFGGPVESGRGFVLHSPDYETEDATLQVGKAFAMTASVDILQQLAKGTGPSNAMLMLGYSGWGPGQLEEEIVHNGWLIADAEPGIVFEQDAGGKWQAALATLGIDPILLSAQGGRA